MKRVQKPKKRFLGMTATQIAVLLLLGSLLIGVMGLGAFLVFGNSATGISLPDFNVSNPSQAIIGRWERYVEPTPTPTFGPGPTQAPIVIEIGCDFGYPPNIEFFSDGTYAGPAVSVWSDFYVWQGGEYEILDNGRIKMQTKNGFAVYIFSVTRDKLTFVDDNECKFIYQHVK